jgi:outer membrane protein assembly factor BamE (lipoprotein component of BamABCDE complex)
MRFACVIFGIIGLMPIVGCEKPHRSPAEAAPAGPKYVENWGKIKMGMSKSEVRKLLGMPSYVSRYVDDRAHVSRAREFGDDKAALKADVEAIFGEPIVWQYGKPDVLDPGQEAFLVYFDAGGHVVRWRQPVKGPQADAVRPASPPADGDDALRNQSPEELWNTPTLQRK